jgi:hypothetical protein
VLGNDLFGDLDVLMFHFTDILSFFQAVGKNRSGGLKGSDLSA